MSKVLAPPTHPPPSEVRRSSPWRYGPTRGPGARPGTAHSRRPRPPLPPAALRTGASGSAPAARARGRARLPASAARSGLSPAGASRCLLAPASPAPQARWRRAGGGGVRIWAGLPEVLTQLGPVFSTSRTVFESLPGPGWSQPDPTPRWAGSGP